MPRRVKSPVVKKDALAVQDAILTRRLESMRNLATMDRDGYLHLVAHMRATNPHLTAPLSDEELIRTVFVASNREATAAAFKSLKRDRAVIG